MGTSEQAGRGVAPLGEGQQGVPTVPPPGAVEARRPAPGAADDRGLRSRVLGVAGDVGALARALAGAIQDASAVGKDSYNSFSKYKYASAEALLSEGRGPIAQRGLAVVPMGLKETRHGVNKGGYIEATITKRLLLIHEGGGQILIELDWPANEQKGRPLDKAVAGATTTCLAYWIRDTLLLPREEQNVTADTRDDSGFQGHNGPPPQHRGGPPPQHQRNQPPRGRGNNRPDWARGPR